MNKQLIFCLETNKKANTDWIYINEYLKMKYGHYNNIKFTPEYMGSKQRYNSNAVIKRLRDKRKMYPGKSYVLMCIDTDNLNSNQTQKKEYEKIKTYCKEKDYFLIWFHIDIEDVFQGHKVDNKQKVKEASNFQKHKMIKNLDLSVFEKNKESQHGSNLGLVLEEILGTHL